MTTCQTGTIVWNYAGPSPAQLTLGLTDVNVMQSATSTPPPSIVITLASDIDPTIGNWTWEQVDVPSGYYIVNGSVLDANAQTDEFFIANGSDTSCIQTQSSTPSSTPSSTTTQLPISVSSHKTSVGAIVGGSVGGVIVIGTIIGAVLFSRRDRRLSSRRGAAVGKWGGLGSTGPGDPFTRDKVSTKDTNHGPSESMGGILNDVDPAIITTASSRDDSLDEEKMASSITSTRKLGSVAVPLNMNTHHRISTSSSGRNRPSTAFERIPMPVIDTTESHRRFSVDIPGHASAISTPDTPRPSPMSPRRPGNFSTEAIPMDRSASGSRRTSRKPVPAYDEAEIEAHNGYSNLPLPPKDSSSSHTTDNISSSPKNKSIPGDVQPMHLLMPDMPPSTF